MTITGTGALEVTSATKRFGGTVALSDVDLTVHVGEVHALLGQNGSGKSTLVKCLTGVTTLDTGRVEIFGESTDDWGASHLRDRIAVIHQDLGLVDSMTVLENLGVTAGYGTRMLSPVDTRNERKIYDELMERIGFRVDLNALVATLSPAERTFVAIVRASRVGLTDGRGQVFILDEPTAALSRTESDRLLKVIRRFADNGAGVLFISHRLSEVMDICDRATVLRAGKKVAEVSIGDVTRGDLVGHMLGERLDDYFPHPPPEPQAEQPVRLEVTDLRGGRLDGVTFSAYEGEVLGVTGLAGMGQEDLPLILCGSQSPSSGSFRVSEQTRPITSPSAAIENGVLLVPGNRLRDGLWIAGTVEENLSLPVLKRFRNVFGLSTRRLRRRARDLVSEYRVHPPRPDFTMGALSGGNQQKVVFAKWLQLDPRVLILDEPTQGVDPGAAKVLLGEAVDAATRGAAVIIISGDYEQIAAVCSRALVLHHGHLIAELHGEQLTEDALVRACEPTSSLPL